MSLLLRSRAARQAQSQDADALQRSWDARVSDDVARALNSRLEFEPPVEPAELTRLTEGWARTLWGLEREGFAFIAGFFWHGNPSESFYVGARRGRHVRGRMPWPPENAIALDAETWAPRGYVPVPRLSAFAEAFD